MWSVGDKIMPDIEDLMDYHKCPGPGWTWFSVCSGHSLRADGTYHETDTECNRCMAGRWVNDKEHEEDVKLHDEDYDAWYKKHNAPDSDARRFLKAVFPNLK